MNQMNEKLFQEMEDYAKDNRVPIMQSEGIEFLCDLIQNNHIKEILEIGSAIGYSAIKMASIDQGIKITTIERDHNRYTLAKQNIEKAKLMNQIQIFEMDAFDFQSEEQYDLIFIDAAKAQYIKFFEKFKHNLKQDGVIVSDNLEFHGMVSGAVKVEHSRNLRQLVRKIREYVTFLEENTEFDTNYYPVGDGIAVSRWHQ